MRQPPEPIELEDDVEVVKMRPAEQKQEENRKEKQEQKQDIHQETETKTTVPADDPNDWEIEKFSRDHIIEDAWSTK